MSTYTELRKSYLREWYCWHQMVYRCEHNLGVYGSVDVDQLYQGQTGFINLIDDIGPRPSDEHMITRIDKQQGFCPGM